MSLIKKHKGKFLNYLILKRNYRPITISVMKSRMKIINQWLTKNKLTFNHKGFEKFLLYRKEIKTHSRYIEAFINGARVFCDYLISQNLLDTNWAKTIPLPPRTNPIPDVLTFEEVEMILKTTIKHCYKQKKYELLYNTILSLLATTGMRVGELCNLRIINLQLDGIEPRLTISDSKTREARVLPLPPNLIKPLRKLIKGREITDYVFVSVTRQSQLPSQLINQNLTARAKKAGITKRVYPHLLRHTFATLLLREGASLFHVQRLLGHRQIQSTAIYTHLVFSDLREAQNKLLKKLWQS